MDVHLSHHITNVADVDFFRGEIFGQEFRDESGAVINRVVLCYAELMDFGDRRINLRN